MSAARNAGEQPKSLILTRSAIAALMRPRDWLEAVEAGFRAAAEGRAESPAPMAIEGIGGAFHAKAAAMRGDRSWVALKLNGNFPGNSERHGLPTIQGAVLLCDGATGALLAILDSIEMTLRRTAAATALAARFLAPPDAATILVCGCGAQGLAQLEALRDLLPLRRCLAWDRDEARARALADAAGAMGLEAEIAGELGLAGPASDVVVTCTTARAPFLEPFMVRDGAFVAAVGADSPDKAEIAPALTARARVVADVLDQCAALGDLRGAIAAGATTRDRVHAELAELVGGTKAGRTSADETWLFDSTGTALQDVAAAALIYERAASDPDRGRVALAA